MAERMTASDDESRKAAAKHWMAKMRDRSSLRPDFATPLAGTSAAIASYVAALRMVK
jgi:hypothetical protein